MTGFFRKTSLAAVVLVLAVCVGPVSAAEGDADTSPDVVTNSAVDSGSDPASASPVAVAAPDVVLEVHDTFTVPSLAVANAAEDAVEDTVSLLTRTLRDLIGTYTPRTQTVTTYYDGQPIAVEEQVIPGLAGLDWEWLISAAVFAISLYCVFRMIGGVLRWS